MRKKLLSLLTVLCLVLGMLPTTALAAATEAYEKNEVAQIITTDTEITEDVDGLVLVDAPCKVTVTDAKLSVGIVVSPDAAGAEVELNGATESAEVVVLAAASVKVDATANAGAVTVDAAEVKLEVAGNAEVALTENATDVTVAAAEGATVSVATAEGSSVTVTTAEGASVTVDAAKGAEVTVDAAKGAEVTVTVAEGATATVTAAEGATVALDVAEGAEVSIDVAEGAEVAINGDGAESVEVTGDGAASVTVNGETASDEEEEKKDEENKDDDKDKGDTPIDFGNNTVSQTKVKICWSPQGTDDQSADLSGTHKLNGVEMTGTTKTTTVDMTSTNNGPYRGTVNITAANLQEHSISTGSTAPDGTDKGYWIGFGVELPAKAEGTYTESTSAGGTNAPYKYYVIEKSAEATWDTAGAFNRVYKVTETDDLFFNTLYFDVTPPEPTGDGGSNVVKAAGSGDDEDAATPVHAEYIVVVTQGVVPDNNGPTCASAEGAVTVTIDGASENLTLAKDEEIVYIFDVTIDAADTTAASGAGGAGGSGD